MAEVTPPPPPPHNSVTPSSHPQSLIVLDRSSAFHQQPPPPPPAPGEEKGRFGGFSFRKRPPIRVTSEFDSDSSLYLHKISSKFFDGLAKFKLNLQNNTQGEVINPQISIITKNLIVQYDVEDRNALVSGSLKVGPNIQLRGSHDIKAQQGEVAMKTNLADPAYSLELTSAVPSIGLPKAAFAFPAGEVSLEEKENEEEKRILSVSSLVKATLMNGVCTAFYNDDTMNLKYCYKDEEMSFVPSVSLPSNALSLAFKRRFGPSDKLSYWYNFDSNYWSTVYKHTVGKEYKFKAGYDSEVRLGWASLWVGDENGKAKSAPLKMKVQFMLQVPQDDIKSSTLMFRVKKRWDI
ncbi:hypothetical protein V2J09_021134 [Rumex salicifolius]